MQSRVSSSERFTKIERAKATGPALVMLALLIFAMNPCSGLAQTLKIGEPAPKFSVKLLHGGRTIHLGDFRGRRVLVFAWASW